MRFIALLVVAVAVVITAPAQAAWKEYNYPDLGIRKDFPVEPQRAKGNYRSAIVPDTPADVLTAEYEGAIYKLTVVPLKHQMEEGASIMGECSYLSLTQAAKALGDFSSNFGFGRGGVYGRWTSVDMPNKNRIVTACYFTKGNLYKIEAIITPQHAAFPNAPEAMRFVNALDFNVNRDDTPRGARAEQQ